MTLRKIMYGIKKKRAKEISKQIKEKTGVDLFGKMEKIKLNASLSIILVDKSPLIIEYRNLYYLSVYGVLKFKPEKNKVIVDKGAKAYILNGADIMRPGVVYADEKIKRNEFVHIEVENLAPVAVGIALMDGKEMNLKERGKAVKNIHYVGDKIWNFLLQEGFIG